MAAFRCAENLLTGALFILHVSQKSVFNRSQSDFAVVSPSGVCSSAPSRDPGSSGFSGYGSLVYCVYMFAGTHRCRKFRAEIVVTWLSAHGIMWMSCILMSSCRVGSPTILATIGGKLAVTVAKLVGAWEDAIMMCFLLSCFYS